MRDIDNIADKISKNYRKVATDKVDGTTRNKILKEMNDVLMSGTAKNGKVKPLFGKVNEICNRPYNR